MKTEEIRRAIEASPLAGEVERMMSWVKPAVRLRTYLAEDGELALGASRMGGTPDLPSGTSWPQNKGRPMEFLAQVDLAEVAQAYALPELPTSGWLAVFYDTQNGLKWEFGGWRTIYFDGEASSLVRTEHPGEPTWSYNLCEVTFEREDCLPNCSDYVPGFNEWEEIHGDTYWDHFLEPEMERNEPHHRLGGYPMLIQSGFGSDDRMNWEHVLQIDTDYETGWMWGDAGRLFFWTRRDNRIVRPFGGAVGGLLHARIASKRRWHRKFKCSWCITECY